MRLLKSLLACFFLIAGLSAAQAQIKAGAGLAYGFDIEEIGLQLIAEYDVDETWAGAASFLYWLEGTEGLSFWELNANAHYKFFENETLDVYALGGLNYYHFSVDLGQFGTESDGSINLNLGAGAHMPFTEQLTGRAEARFTIGNGSQLILAVGALYAF